MKSVIDFISKNWLSVIVSTLVIGIVIFLMKKGKGWLVSTGRIKPDDKYGIIAYNQHKAMRNLGTDTKMLFTSLAGLKDSELIKVFDCFGFRNYAVGGMFFELGPSLNIIQWYYKELSGGELSAMKLIWAGTSLFEKYKN
jgi:hypothetical protein